MKNVDPTGPPAASPSRDYQICRASHSPTPRARVHTLVELLLELKTPRDRPTTDKLDAHQQAVRRTRAHPAEFQVGRYYVAKLLDARRRRRSSTASIRRSARSRSRRRASCSRAPRGARAAPRVQRSRSRVRAHARAHRMRRLGARPRPHRPTCAIARPASERRRLRRRSAGRSASSRTVVAHSASRRRPDEPTRSTQFKLPRLANAADVAKLVGVDARRPRRR